MKNKYLYITIYVLALMYLSCGEPFKESKIKLVLTGSVHGQLDPCGWKKNPLGGLSRKYVKIKEMRENGESPIILDAGDMFFSTANLNNNNIKSTRTKKIRQ